MRNIKERDRMSACKYLRRRANCRSNLVADESAVGAQMDRSISLQQVQEGYAIKVGSSGRGDDPDGLLQIGLIQVRRQILRMEEKNPPFS